MKIRIFYSLCIICLTILAGIAKAKADVRIVTSIAPLSAIVRMLVDDNVRVDTIAASQACPHHYQMKPSDLEIIRSADLVIYLNEKFDGFIVKSLATYNKNYIKVSDFKNIKLLKTSDNQINWHLWLDLENVGVILKHLSTALSGSFPEMREQIAQNLISSEKLLLELSNIKLQQINNSQNIVLLNSHVEYFFSQWENIHKPCSNDHKSLKCIANLERILEKYKEQCIVVANDSDSLLLDKTKACIAKLEPDNWNYSSITRESFYTHYLNMINLLSQCNR